jgi:hypothetical protein
MHRYGKTSLRSCIFLSLACLQAQAADPIDIHVDWQRPLLTAATTATFQVVVNPLIRRESPIHSQVFDAVRALNADHVRFVPWMPYPRLAVAELRAPTATETFWDFSLIDPMVEDFYAATAGKPVMLNFSTIPQWLFETDWEVGYPSDPNEPIWNYEQGTELRDRSLKELGDYYARLVSWYTRGGFWDELGRWHESGHRYRLDTWEVLNEPDAEHLMTAEQYTERYDAIVSAVREVSPTTEFMGLSLMRPMNLPHYFEYFLDARNHQAGIPIDWISYHFYATAQLGESLESQVVSLFRQSDDFIAAAGRIRAQRDRLSPGTKIAINEVGTMMAEDFSGIHNPIPPRYWNLSAAVYAYVFAELTKLGTDLVGQSQIVGFPNQFPSVTMLDWESGAPNARYRVLKLILDHYTPGDQVIEAASSRTGDVSVLALRKADGTRKLLLVNRSNEVRQLRLPVGAQGWVETLAPSSPAPLQSEMLPSGDLELEGLAVSFVTF